MKFTPTWYQKDFDLPDIPSFQELEDITGSAFTDDGTYVGPKEKPEMQLVMDTRTKRQYWAPKEYDDDAIKYGIAKLQKDFNSKEWWGMVHDPHLTTGEKISTAWIEAVKTAGKTLAKAGPELMAGVTGLTDAVGIDSGALAKFAFINNPTNLPIYLASSLYRKGAKATAQDYLQLLKDIKTPKGQMGETAKYWQATTQNYSETLDKYFPDVDENIRARSTLVAIGGIAGQVGSSLLLAAGVNQVGGLKAVASVFGTQQFYQLREEYLQKGYSLDSANIWAAIGGGVEGAWEGAGFGGLLKFATLKPSLRNVLISGFIESLQEGAQTASEEFITNVLTDVREETLAEILANISISMAAGFVPGAGFSLAARGMNISMEKAEHDLGKAFDKSPIKPQPENKQAIKEGHIIKGTTPKQELELAKANKGSNDIYEMVKNIANAYNITDEAKIDALYYYARNERIQGKTTAQIMEGLGKQLVAYNDQLKKGKPDKEEQEAAKDISYHLSEEAAQKFHNDNVKALQQSGIEEAQAHVLAKQQDRIFKRLSEVLGFNLQEFKPVKVTTVYYPGKEDMQGTPESKDTSDVPFQSRALSADEEIKGLQKQIDQLDKLANKKPRTNLLSTLRKTGVDYNNTRLDPQKLKDLHIKNVPVSKGGLGGESLEYLIRHGFMYAEEQNDRTSYEEQAEKESQAEKMLESAISGEQVYPLEYQEQLAASQEAQAHKAQLQDELDNLLAEKGKRGYIEIGDTLNKIVLGKYADVTTLQHELMHHWKNVIEVLAAQGNKKAQALKAQMDAIIEKHKSEVKQDINKEEEVLSEAFEKWLYLGGHGNTAEEISLFKQIQRFFKDVYESAQAVTGINMDPEIDSFFKQITGLEPIQIQQSNSWQEDSSFDLKSYLNEKEVKANIEKSSDNFSKEIDNLDKTFSDKEPIVLFSMNKLWTRVGLSDKKLVFSKSKIKKVKKDHGLTDQDLKQLPRLISNPEYIFESSTGDTAFVAVLTRTKRPLIVAIDMVGKNAKIKNIIKSTYNKGPNFIEKEIKADHLLYDKKNPTRYRQHRAPIAQASNPSGTISIANQTGIVKAQKLFQDDKDRAFQYSLFKAEEMGEKVADSRPSKEQVAKDVAAIRNSEIQRSQSTEGFWGSVGSFFKDTVLSVRQRAGAVDPKLKYLFDKLDFFEINYEKKFAEVSKKFIRKYRVLEAPDRAELDYYIYNRCDEELHTFLKAHDMEEEYKAVRNMLNDLYELGNMYGINMNFMHEYFPTLMQDYKGFVSYMLKTNKWTYIENALKELDPENTLTDEEKAIYINKILRGRVPDLAKKPAAAKAREILYKDPNLMQFYAPSDEALKNYVASMSKAIATHQAFGMGPRGQLNIEQSIGGIVQALIDSHTITPQEEAVIKKLLRARLTNQPTPPWVRWFKNVGYLTMMNNVTNAITQLGDFYAAFYKYGFAIGLKATFSKSEITTKDLGIDDIWEEFSDEKGTAKLIKYLFKAVGLEKFDKLGKHTAIQASWLNLRAQAAQDSTALMARLAQTFGKDAGRVLEDIKAGNITDEVKLLVFCDLADTQPIGKSGVPVNYLNHPTARLFYQLKTFTLNQLSLAYYDGVLNIERGIRYRDMKQFTYGSKKLFSLLTLLTLFGAGADTIKNLLMGRDVDIPDALISNLLWQAGLSKYTFYKGKREGYATAVFLNYLPPQASLGDDIYKDIRQMREGKKKGRDSQLWTYAPFGRTYYWWFGGGSEAGKKRTEKMKKVAAKHNRKKKK